MMSRLRASGSCGTSSRNGLLLVCLAAFLSLQILGHDHGDAHAAPAGIERDHCDGSTLHLHPEALKLQLECGLCRAQRKQVLLVIERCSIEERSVTTHRVLDETPAVQPVPLAHDCGPRAPPRPA